VVVYNMSREAPRMLHSLSAGYYSGRSCQMRTTVLTKR
jgi:hypothetical protein